MNKLLTPDDVFFLLVLLVERGVLRPEPADPLLRLDVPLDGVGADLALLLRQAGPHAARR